MEKFIIAQEDSESTRRIELRHSYLIVADKVRHLFYALKIGAYYTTVHLENFLRSIKNVPCSKENLTFYLCAQENGTNCGSILIDLNKFKIQPLPIHLKESEQEVEFDFSSLEIKSIEKARPKLRVFIVEDSLSMLKVLKKIYGSHPEVEIVGEAMDVKEAAEGINKSRPDLISLDMILPSGTGLELMQRIDTLKTNVVLVTDCSDQQGGLVFNCLSIGASTYFKKPALSEIEEFKARLHDYIHEIYRKRSHVLGQKPLQMAAKPIDVKEKKLIALASSTGGTEIVRDLLKGFPLECPPIVIVQHMPAEFTRLFAERLTHQTGRKTIEVKSEMELLPNHAYLAAGGTHLKVKQVGQRLLCYVSEGLLVNNFKPSISVLFESLHRVNLGNTLVACMLSGMGRDGAVEMKLLRSQGTLCIGQSEESCTVYGMPRAAKELDALDFELSPDEMIKKMGGRVKRTA